jgi:hypothetical protein
MGATALGPCFSYLIAACMQTRHTVRNYVHTYKQTKKHQPRLLLHMPPGRHRLRKPAWRYTIGNYFLWLCWLCRVACCSIANLCAVTNARSFQCQRCTKLHSTGSHKLLRYLCVCVCFSRHCLAVAAVLMLWHQAMGTPYPYHGELPEPLLLNPFIISRDLRSRAVELGL